MKIKRFPSREHVTVKAKGEVTFDRCDFKESGCISIEVGPIDSDRVRVDITDSDYLCVLVDGVTVCRNKIPRGLHGLDAEELSSRACAELNNNVLCIRLYPPRGD